MNVRLVFLFFLMTVLAGLPHRAFAQARPEMAANYTTQSGIVYTQGVHGPLQADAYIPNGAGPFPGIVFIHGGGWINGDRSQMIRLIQELANSGYTCFTIDYDVYPVHYPAALHESLAAVRYVREHAAELHLDPKRIAVAGSSAGGELAALVALNPEGKTIPAGSAQNEDAIAPVQGAIVLNGVLDLEALGDGTDMVTKYLGAPCSQSAAACADASPTTHVHAGAPAFYVGHGTLDATVPFAEADSFVAGLKKARVPVQFFTAQGGKHTYWANDQFFARNLAEIKSFLALVLAPAGSK